MDIKEETTVASTNTTVTDQHAQLQLGVHDLRREARVRQALDWFLKNKNRSIDRVKRSWLPVLWLLFALAAWAQDAKYPPLTEYMMPRDAEIALARSAAPASISDRATIKVLTTSGYQVARAGASDGFVCMVMRGWSAPTYTPAQVRDLVYDAKLRAPICFDPVASRTVMPYYELRSKLAMEGNTPTQIAEGIQAAYAKGVLPKRDGVSFAYMWSADQNLGAAFRHWHPHMMVFSPSYENSMIGGNEFGRPLPLVTDDAGTPFAVVVIPVDDELAIKAAEE
jgi:hypothetical protein